MRDSIRHRLTFSRAIALRRLFGPEFLLASGLLAGTHVAAQTQAAQLPSSTNQIETHHRTRPTPARPETAAKLPSTQAVPPTPYVSDWPVNDRPSPASVKWDSRELHINATNSSLQQILSEVESATGAKVEGLGKDERVFGDFGPGQARDVVFQLLQGSGYNILMIGDEGQGVPREIVLSARNTSKMSATAVRPVQEDTEDDAPDNQYDPQPQPLQPPQPLRPGLSPDGGPPIRTPQQIQQELQQRQQQMQQQQPPQGQPPNPQQNQ
jgi:hypothetical protein